MTSSLQYAVAADALLLLHFAFVLFVIFGLLLTWVGWFRSWQWVRNPWFRLGHLLAIGVVISQSWAGMICPLTQWEMQLREKAGGEVYTGSFIAHWIHELLYYQAPWWVFAVAYSLFGGLVLLSWFYVRPRPFGAKRVR